MCYNFNCRLVLDLYILFQSFRTVFITQKLGSYFKYQLHCFLTCVIIITLSRSLNFKWLKKLSSYILFKLAVGKGKSKKHSYSKLLLVLPINKYDLIKFFPTPFFIKFLVSIFETIIDFMFRNVINTFLNYKYIFNIFNPLSANTEKWANTLKQIVGNLPTICLSVFGHFMNLALKGLRMNFWYYALFLLFLLMSLTYVIYF